MQLRAKDSCAGDRAQRLLLAATAALFLSAAPAPAQAPEPSIRGRVSFEGKAPAPQLADVSSDPQCVPAHPKGIEKVSIDVSGGGLANAFVWIKSGVSAPPPAPTEPVVLDQRGCEFQPHIVAVRTSQPLEMRNSDDSLHNIHPKPTVNGEFNIGQPRSGMSAARAFEHQEVMIPVICDVHPWMRAYVAVVDHPYFAVTAPDGTYAIGGLPPGKYEVEAWHETLGTQSRTVTVKASGPVWADFAYRP